MFRLLAIVSTSDELSFSMPKFFPVVSRTIDSQLLKCTASYSTHSETEQEAFRANVFLAFLEKYLQIISTSLSSSPSKRPAILLSVSSRVNYHILDISGIGSLTFEVCGLTYNPQLVMLCKFSFAA